jgi:hypothetical protein
MTSRNKVRKLRAELHKLGRIAEQAREQGNDDKAALFSRRAERAADKLAATRKRDP